MGYEVVWNPKTSSWAVWSTVVDDFVAKGLSTPEAVAEYVVDDEPMYYCGKDREMICKAEYTSRQQIIDYFELWIKNAKKSCHQERENGEWKEKCIDADTVRKNLTSVMDANIKRWDSGEMRPDPQAQQDSKAKWITEALAVKRGGQTGIDVTRFRMGSSGLEFEGEERKEP